MEDTEKYMDKYQCKLFLNTEKVFIIISEEQPLMHCLNDFSPHFWDKNVKFLLTYRLRNIAKQNRHEIYPKVLKQLYNTL